jgi:2-dehydropantoate 2-reductase
MGKCNAESVASIAVVGLGSIGTIFAAHLQAAGRHRVFSCVRAPVDCLTVDGEYGRVEASPECFLDPAATPEAEWVLLATKAQDTPAAAPWLDRLCRPNTVVAVLQNGIDHEIQAAPFCGPAKVLPTVVYANGKKLAPHHIRHLCPAEDLVVPNNEEGRALTKLFEKTLLRVKVETDFAASRWRKFLANLVANPLTALTGRGIEVVRSGEMEHLALGILHEAVAVGRSSGVVLAEDAPAQTLQWMSRYPGDTGTSMLQDRRDGRALEIGALNGSIVRLGVQLGVPTPLNRAVCALLEAVQ